MSKEEKKKKNESESVFNLKEIEVLKEHTRDVTCVKYSKEHKLLLTCAWDCRILIREMVFDKEGEKQEKKKIQDVKMNSSVVDIVFFGRNLAIFISETREISVYSLIERKVLKMFKASGSPTFQNVLQLDEDQFLVGSNNGSMLFFSMKEILFKGITNFKKKIICESGNSWTAKLVKTEKNKFITAGGSHSKDYFPRKYDFETKKKVGMYRGHTKWVNVIELFVDKDDKEILITGGYGRELKFYRVDNYRLLRIIKTKHVNWSILIVARQYVIMGNTEGEVSFFNMKGLYNVDGDSVVKEVNQPLNRKSDKNDSAFIEKKKIHSNWTRSLCWISNRIFCSGSYDNSCKILELSGPIQYYDEGEILSDRRERIEYLLDEENEVVTRYFVKCGEGESLSSFKILMI